MSVGRPVALKVIGAGLSLAGVLAFTCGLTAGIAVVIDGGRLMTLLTPSLLAVGLVLIWAGNRLQGWGLLRKRRSSRP